MATEEVLYGEHISFEDDAEGGYRYLNKLSRDESNVFFYYARNKADAYFRDDRGYQFVISYSGGAFTIATY